MIHKFNFYEKVSMVRMNSGEQTMLEWRIREKKFQNCFDTMIKKIEQNNIIDLVSHYVHVLYLQLKSSIMKNYRE